MQLHSALSGRVPEQRGNGLRFVRTTIESTAGAGIACLSGDGQVQYGEEGQECLKMLNRNFKVVSGTVTLIVWRLS